MSFIRVEGNGWTLKGVKCFWARPWRKFEHERTGGDWIAGGGRREQAGGRAKSGMNGGKRQRRQRKGERRRQRAQMAAAAVQAGLGIDRTARANRRELAPATGMEEERRMGRSDRT